MSRIVLLDAGPVGLAVSPTAKADSPLCRAWLVGMEVAGVDVFIPTIVDYEVRRELIRVGATTKLRALDDLTARFGPLDVSASAYRRAAEFWATVRRAGRPTASDEALDVDTIIAGVAATLAGAWDTVTVATNNVGHFKRFPGIDAQVWKVMVERPS